MFRGNEPQEPALNYVRLLSELESFKFTLEKKLNETTEMWGREPRMREEKKKKKLNSADSSFVIGYLGVTALIDVTEI